MPNPKKLADWLEFIQTLHPFTIDMTLERVKEVASRLNLLNPSSGVVITVGGTNGKGSTVATLESLYFHQGYKVGAFTTPFLFEHNEQVRLSGQKAADEDFIQAFQRIAKARGDIPLTPFEFNTLAALWIFKQENVDVMLLEVGLGGRLDAVNIIDADCTIITSIDLDHTDRLGNTRELIAAEKAGIFRANTPVICGDIAPPKSLLEQAMHINVPLFVLGKDFSYRQEEETWSWQSSTKTIQHLPPQTLQLQNIATALMAIDVMQAKLPVNEDAIMAGLNNLHLPGRLQIIPGTITHIIDVAHNPASVSLLANYLQQHPIKGKTIAVFSMLADKDIYSTIKMIESEVDSWHVAEIDSPRACPKAQLEVILENCAVDEWFAYPSLKIAYEEACGMAKPHDRVVIFGSFFTIAALESVLPK